jgi:hypothetical protein
MSYANIRYKRILTGKHLQGRGPAAYEMKLPRTFLKESSLRIE